jgi:hypothetical protein
MLQRLAQHLQVITCLSLERFREQAVEPAAGRLG